ncbi:arginyltransferase [Paraferrimonas sp. SM1919]|uniref:arginyltransferase n=1 Tax=Paraferrimonas sp. SM1919 TaxID=2662263 RepID=UPI0013CFD252|nr:arginyltransferase [Paraferrimonas sp. SM1919]
MELNQLTFGISGQSPCSYLEDRLQRIIAPFDEQPLNAKLYQQLIEIGFRRSGDHVYRPHCIGCNQCQSLKVSCHEFNASKSQKRILAKAKAFEFTWHDEVQDDFYPLYEKYITARHQDGDMYPPSKEQFMGFLPCQWLAVRYLAIYHGKKLIGVGVFDQLALGLSAVYSFFEPEYESYSIGKLSVLQAIKQCQKMSLPFMYLGYYIEPCSKMNYKTQFKPHQLYNGEAWV